MSCRPTRPPLLAKLPFLALPWFLLATRPLIMPLLGWLLAWLFIRCFFSGVLVRLLPNRLFMDCLCLELDLFRFCWLPLFTLSLLKLLLLSLTLVGAICKFPREFERLKLLCELDLERLERELARARELALLWLPPRELERVGAFPRCWRCKARARRGSACCCWGWLLRSPRRLAKLFEEFERLKAGVPLSFRLEYKYELVMKICNRITQIG